MASPLAIIAGAGPGVGAALARRFAREGYRVALIARNLNRLSEIAGAIEKAGGKAAVYSADLSDHAEIRRAIGAIIADQGSPSVLIWNAALWDETPALALEVSEFDRQIRLGLTGALTAVQAAAPVMIAIGGGSILLTGGGLALAPQYGGAVPALAAVKSALRGFVHASAPEFAEQGLRLGTVTIAGQVTPGTAFDPDHIAEAFWKLHADLQPKVELVFDGS